MLEAATADNHKLVSCTHFARKGDEIVGAFTLGPIVMWWLRSDCTFRDTAICMADLRARAEEMGLKTVVMLCAQGSPYARHMKKLGCEFIGTTNIYERQV